jgi:ComF family protein
VSVRSLLRAAEAFLLPPACLGCRRYLADGTRLVCPTCASRLPRVPHPRCPRCDAPLRPGQGPAATGCRECVEWPSVLTGSRQAAALDGVARDLVHALKYEGWERAGAVMAQALLPLLPEDSAWGGASLVPVPSAPERVRSRGFGQADILARELSLACGRPLLRPLRRQPGGASQVTLHPEERRANVEGAFRIRQDPDLGLEGRPVLLVDDVLTTGATASEVSRVLEGAGAGPIHLLAFARTLPDRGIDPGATGTLPDPVRLLRRRQSPSTIQVEGARS